MVYSILGGQAGFEGKAQITGFLIENKNEFIRIVTDKTNSSIFGVSSSIPNERHMTYSDGKKIALTYLPISCIDKGTKIILGAESLINPSQFLKEILFNKKLIGRRKVFVHKNASVTYRDFATFNRVNGITSSDTIYNFEEWWYMFSRHGIKGFEEFWEDDVNGFLRKTVCPIDITELFNDIQPTDTIILEGSSGCDLDKYFGLGFSEGIGRCVSIGALSLSSSVFPLSTGNENILVLRPYGLRGILTEELSDRGGYPNELNWAELSLACGARKDITEFYSVTGKPFHIYNFDWNRLAYNCKINHINHIALTHLEYLDYPSLDCVDYSNLSPIIKNFVKKVEEASGVSVGFLATGNKVENVIDIR